jgi:hypothetical protein
MLMYDLTCILEEGSTVFPKLDSSILPIARSNTELEDKIDYLVEKLADLIMAGRINLIVTVDSHEYDFTKESDLYALYHDVSTFKIYGSSDVIVEVCNWYTLNKPTIGVRMRSEQKEKLLTIAYKVVQAGNFLLDDLKSLDASSSTLQDSKKVDKTLRDVRKSLLSLVNEIQSSLSN